MFKLFRMIHLTSLFLFSCTLFLHCASPGHEGSQSIDSVYLSYDHTIVPYSFYAPDTVVSLDMRLEEISGLTALPNGNLGAVQDENGIVFILDQSGRIQQEIEFGDDNDYEGIEFLDNRFYVMESGGDLYEFRGESAGTSGRKTKTKFDNGNDVEGLGRIGNDLLVACKGQGDAGDFKASGKGVYRVAPISGEIKSLVIEVDEKDLENLLKRRHPNLEVNDFDPSAVAVNPIDQHIYLLSADMLLAIFSQEGDLLEVVPLQRELYRQPEGIAFFPDGTLFISSEAAGREPRLFKFSRK